MLHRDRELKFAPMISTSMAGIIIAALSAGTIAAAWIFEWMGYLPCHLCLEERVPFYVAIGGGIVAALAARPAPKLAALVLGGLCLGFLYNAGLSVYHAGLEWHFWKGPETCSGDTLQVTHSLTEQLKHNTVIPCDVAPLRILGISLAGYNVFLSAAMSAFCFISLRQLIKRLA